MGMGGMQGYGAQQMQGYGAQQAGAGMSPFQGVMTVLGVVGGMAQFADAALEAVHVFLNLSARLCDRLGWARQELSGAVAAAATAAAAARAARSSSSATSSSSRMSATLRRLLICAAVAACIWVMRRLLVRRRGPGRTRQIAGAPVGVAAGSLMESAFLAAAQ